MTYIAKIYKIVNTINDDIYVGSTKNELRVRWQGHKCYAKKIPDCNGLYQMMNEYSFENFRIVLIETVECENKEEQIRHEQRYIDMLKPKLNKHNAYGNKCEHNKLRYRCVSCKGSQICSHNKDKIYCRDCMGSQICSHKKQRKLCKLCKGSGLCVHLKEHRACKQCDGYRTQKVYCYDCDREFIRSSSKKHYESASHLRNTLSSVWESKRTKKSYCYDCDCEIYIYDKRHYNSVKHLRNTLPINY
jgi:hypothetical protein